jgi:hypothetical protein
LTRKKTERINMRLTKINLATCVALSCSAAGVHLVAQAQSNSTYKPPTAQAYIDLATHASDMPGMGAAGAFAGGGGLSSLFGGRGGSSGGGNVFGNTRTGFSPGKYMDVSVFTRNNASLTDATQNIPGGFNLGDALKLAAPTEKYDPPTREDEPLEPRYERPKGRMMLYWGCGDTIRAGQPKILDAANASLADMQKFFGTMRTSTTRGARLATGHPVWPQKNDDRKIPDSASTIGEHKFVGSGIPDSFKVSLGNTQDFLGQFSINQDGSADSTTKLSWSNLNQARGYFLSAFGSNSGNSSGSNGSGNDMIIWTSSEVAELGFGLVDYQTNAAVDGWIRDRVVLPTNATQCSIPKGIFNGGAMLRGIAYGSESSFIYPPRPADPQALAQWQPEWSAKVRVKSTFMSMLGGMQGAMRGARNDVQREEKREERKDSKPNPVDLLKGIFGR